MDLGAISSVTSNIATTYAKSTTSDSSVKEKTESSSSSSASSFSSEAAVYEKSSDTDSVSTKKNSSTDRSALVKQLQADSERLKNNLLDIVRKSITGQGNAFAIASEDDLWHVLASGNFTADANTIAQAKADIADDGYWGVDQTSSRIVDFAITLSGNDTSKAETLIEAFKKGYAQATGSWGKDLPDISSKTYDAVLEKFQAWQDGTYNSSAVEE